MPPLSLLLKWLFSHLSHYSSQSKKLRLTYCSLVVNDGHPLQVG